MYKTEFWIMEENSMTTDRIKRRIYYNLCFHSYCLKVTISYFIFILENYNQRWVAFFLANFILSSSVTQLIFSEFLRHWYKVCLLPCLWKLKWNINCDRSLACMNLSCVVFYLLIQPSNSLLSLKQLVHTMQISILV